VGSLSTNSNRERKGEREMKAKNCTMEELQAALDIVNVQYKGNVGWKSLDPQRKQIAFTLKVRDSKGPGHRLGFPQPPRSWKGETNWKPGKRMPFACWHVHGYFFEALFQVNPNAAVLSGRSWITKDGGNWQDRNIGSQAYPLMFSEACECE